MDPLGFLIYIVRGLLQLLLMVVFASAVLSWLVQFDVVNLRNRLVYDIARFLDAVTRPVLRPIQKIIPPLGGIDISPVILFLIIGGALRYLIPPA